MKRILLFLIASACVAQTQLSLSSPAPSSVTNAAATGGSSGSNTYWYWIIANYPIGKAAPSPAALITARATPTAGSPITVAWPGVSGATSYDVLRTTNSAVPTGACTCAVATAQTGGSVSDTGGALSSYTVATTAGNAAATMNLDNKSGSAPFVNIAVQSATGTNNYRVAMIPYTATVGDCASIGTIPGTLPSTACSSSTGITNTIGAVAALPAAGVSVGDQYNANNGFYRYVWTGSLWQPFVGSFLMVNPNLVTFSWANQGGATVSSATGGIVLTAPANSGDSLRLREIVVPATPYSITIKFWATAAGANYMNAGLSLRDTVSGKLVTMNLTTGGGNGSLAISDWTDVNTFSSAPLSAAYLNTSAPFMTMKLYDDGVNRNWYFSQDGGLTFILYRQESNTDFVTPNRVGFFADSNNSTFPVAVSLLSWTQGVN